MAGTNYPDDKYNYFVDQLAELEIGTNLFNVFGQDKPDELNGEWTLLGHVELTSKLTPSRFGDEKLYFRHQRMDDDLKYHPEWEPYTP